MFNSSPSCTRLGWKSCHYILITHQSMNLTCRLSQLWDDENLFQMCLDAGSTHPPSIRYVELVNCYQRATGPFVKNNLFLCVVHRNTQTVMYKAIVSVLVGCYSLWQRGVFGPGPTAEASFYKAVNSGYEPKAYEVSVSESAPPVTSLAPLGRQRLD